ncbi:sialidase family protein [Gimesia maris]|uniref:sialidase family protein n=1 Tax=Gimesia maris TaxID=122 RepID=UPI0030D9706B|tara:strand:- start:146174 stop:147358 length:1185 start_codon:yes stop_codon:yes gene_type:complete
MTMRRRDFLTSSMATTLTGLLSQKQLPAKGESIGENRRLLKPVHDQIVCPWRPEHPRHDHQQIFPLDEQRLLLVWSEYYSQSPRPATRKGHSGISDHVACQISSKISTDQGRSWGEHRVLQPNRWKQNVKHPNLIRLSEQEILFSYVGWDDENQRNVFLRRSTDNGKTWSEQQQISEPGWYCCNADHALRLSTGRILIPAHGPYAKQYVGGTSYKGGDLHSFVFYSDDGFRTWKRSANSMTAPGRGCHEPAIVELKEGRQLCFLRNTNQRLYQSFSDDGGAHWSRPEPTKLPSPESPAIVKRIPSTGDLLLLWNNVASPTNWPRTPLNAAVSQDDGKTWGHFKDIDARPAFDAAYPSITFVNDEAFIAYYSRSTRWKRDSEITLRIYQVQQFYA